METPDFEHVLVNSAAVLKKYPFRLLAQAEYSNNTMRVMRTFLVVALMATVGWMPACAAERVDLLLVLAADISRSVDAVKFQLQRSGYAAAFSNPRVIDAIRGGPSRRIAVTFVEWSGPLSQETVIDWTVIGDEETAHQFSDRIVEAPRAFADSTSISAGIDFAITRLDQAPYEAHRRVIDVSGDGDNNAGRNVAAARDEAIAKGVTINGLVILTELPSLSYSTHTNPPGGLANYYRRNVIGGPGAFVVVAENFNSFGNAIIKKLTREIAHASAAAIDPAATERWYAGPSNLRRLLKHADAGTARGNPDIERTSEDTPRIAFDQWPCNLAGAIDEEPCHRRTKSGLATCRPTGGIISYRRALLLGQDHEIQAIVRHVGTAKRALPSSYEGVGFEQTQVHSTIR